MRSYGIAGGRLTLRLAGTADGTSGFLVLEPEDSRKP